MRLTLRTLLSWKDGMLDASTAADLAARVETSDNARALVQRIDEVMTRPTLSAPAVDATGFAADPNSAAGYLDNVLTAEELAEFERVCFASEAQLAETAGVHDLLAAWSRDPRGPLDATARRRLLAAVRARAAVDPRSGSTPAAEPKRPRRGGVPGQSVAETRSGSRRGGVPPSRPASTPVAAWLLAVTAITLLAALIGMLNWSLTKGGPRRRPEADKVAARSDAPLRKDVARPDVAAGDAAGAVAVKARDATAVPKAGAVEPGTQAPRAAVAKPEAGPSVAPVAAAATAEPREPAASPPPVDPVPSAPPPADAGLAEPREPVPPSAAASPATNDPPPPGAVERRVPQGDALAIAAPAVAAPAAAKPAGPPTPAPPADRGNPVVEGRPIVLERPLDADLNAWRAGSDGSSLELPVDLIAPPFCRPTLLVDGMRIRLEPGTRATLGRDADGTPRLEVVFGRAALAGAGRFGITAGGLAGIVTVALAAPVGVEVKLERGPGEPVEATRRAARLVSAAGPLAWHTTADAVGEPAAGAPVHGQALEWRSGPPPTLTAEAVSQSPSWLIGRDTGDAVERLAAEALSNRLAAGTAAVPALREMAGDRRPENRLAAAATLALVGDFEALARLLAADGPDGLRDGEWTRLDAIAVRQALARGPRAAEAFARAVAAHVPPGVADTVVRLAGGVSPTDLEAGAAEELLAALGSPHLVVRRYAVRNLVALTGDETARSRYRPDRTDEAARAKAAAWWRVRLEQGLVPDDATAAGGDR